MQVPNAALRKKRRFRKRTSYLLVFSVLGNLDCMLAVCRDFSVPLVTCRTRVARKPPLIIGARLFWFAIAFGYHLRISIRTFPLAILMSAIDVGRQSTKSYNANLPSF